MKRVLFLDADGCLPLEPPHSGLQRLCWLPLLADLLRPHRDVHAVLHSSWRHDMPDAWLRQLFAPLGSQFGGTTQGQGRYASIGAYVTSHDVDDYQVVDDMASEYPWPLPPEVIICNGRLGITDARARAALEDWLRCRGVGHVLGHRRRTYSKTVPS